jgi:hypothetical protein
VAAADPFAGLAERSAHAGPASAAIAAFDFESPKQSTHSPAFPIIKPAKYVRDPGEAADDKIGTRPQMR